MKIAFVGQGCVDNSVALSNHAHAKSLGIPFIEDAKAHNRKLAVVGGGPSIVERLDELRAFSGDIWAVNGAFGWCRSNGIEATFISVDPQRGVADLARGAASAIVSTQCDPEVFNALHGASVSLVGITPVGDTPSGVTTATAIPAISVKMGYGDVCFYGCESSIHGTKRAYNDDRTEYLMRVAVNGTEYLTEAEYLMQATYLAAVLNAAPQVFSERSGGLLSALAEHGDYDVTAISKTILANLKAASHGD